MFYQLSERITDKFEQLNVISSDDRDIYRYGVQQGCVLLLNLLSIITIGLLCGMLIESILFMLVFVPLRTYAGGYHAKTHIRCYVYSMLTITVILLTMKLLAFDFWHYVLMMAVGCSAILWLAPSEDENKPLDSLEQKAYRKKARLLVGYDALIFLAACLLKSEVVYCSCAMAMFLLGILVIIGQIKNQLFRKSICK